MDAFLHRFQHLKIPLEEIRLATDNFNDKMNYIGGGGFGKVYKGEVSCYKGQTMAAIKRLDRRHGQGTPEFLKEITMLSRYTHENLISLLGFCCEGDEMILVYEHASRGSLDTHLNSSHLMWSQRLKICLDAAKGLSYLHDPREMHQRLIHCDIKSSNILLDDQWNAKVSDFGLSIMGPANEQHSVVVTNPVGTHGYCDPQYAMTHTLTKESDVYSFGVVLFEVLCGTLCYTYNNGCFEQILVPTWIENYKQKQLSNIILKNLNIPSLDQSSLEIVSDIAFRCLKELREDRPTMAVVVTELETAIENQEFSEWKPPFDYEEMIKTAEPPLNYSSNYELRKLLSQGVLLNHGKTWFSLNKNGKHCEMISFAECLDTDPKNSWWFRFISRYSKLKSTEPTRSSRFAAAPFKYYYDIICPTIKIRVKTQFLSLGITYKVNFVFMCTSERTLDEHIRLKYKLQGEKHFSISHLADKREDGWWMCELYQFTSDHRTIDLEMLFDDFCNYSYIEVDGIEFCPFEKAEHKDDKQQILDLDANCEEKLPADYKYIMERSTDSMQWTTEKEAYSIFRKGFLINDGDQWFSLDKNGKKCLMISAAVLGMIHWSSTKKVPLTESRFGKVSQCDTDCTLYINSWDYLNYTRSHSHLLSPQTTYAAYLVYKLPKDQSKFEAPVSVRDTRYQFSKHCIWYIYLVNPQTPVIRPKADQDTLNLLNRPKIKGFPRQRNDGWMEVQFWEFRTASTIERAPFARFDLIYCDHTHSKTFKGLIIEGIEEIKGLVMDIFSLCGA